MTPFIQQLLQAQLPLEWAPVHLVSDDPAKVLGTAAQEGLMLPQLLQRTGMPTQRLDLVSPYFVPTRSGTEALAQLQRSGVQVRVLTNALEATDVAVVHSGYAKYRKPLLQAGIELFEMRSNNPSRWSWKTSSSWARWAARAPACMPRPLPSMGRRPLSAPSTSTRVRPC
jgi:putative cardiolipin synthase